MTTADARTNRRRGEARPSPDADRSVWLGEPVTSSSMRGRAARGVGASAAAQGWRLVLQVGSTIVLARLLTPAEFGVVGMVLAVSALADQLKEAGFAQAVVQSRRLTQGQVSNLFWVNVMIGLGLALSLVALARPMSVFYGEPMVEQLAYGISIVYLFSGFGVQHQGLLLRHMRFRSVATRDAVAQTIGVGAALVCAAAGLGPWSLVVLHVVAALSRTVLAWSLCSWRPSLRFVRGEQMRPLLAYGGGLTGFTVLNYLARNADNVLIGRYLGAAELGLYGRAYSLVLLPLQQVSQPLAPVMLSSLSRVTNDAARFRSAYITGLRSNLLVGLPLVTLLVVTCDLFVPLLLGAQWEPSVPIFQWLAVAGAAQLVGTTNGWLYTATGRTTAMLRWALVSRPIIVVSFVVGLRWGAEGVAASYAITTVVLMLPGMALASRSTPVRFVDWVVAVPPAAMVAGTVAGAALLVRFVGYPAGGPGWPELLAAVAAAAVAGAGTVMAVPSTRRLVLDTVRAVRRG